MSAFKKFSLKNRTAIVIGGSGQLGYQTIKILLDAGAKVVNFDLFNKNHKNKNYHFYKVNITNETEVINIKRKFLQKFKKLNILINHSHYKGDPKKLVPHSKFFSSVDKYPSDEWLNTINVNLNGLFYITKHFINILLKNKKSVILNTSSTYGRVSPNKYIYGNSGINNPIGYTTTKFAIVGFTKYLATHFGDKGLRANLLMPGGVENKNMSNEFKRNYKNLTPLKKLAKETDYREAVLFLVSDASDYMTGTEFVIDGGWTAW